MMDLIGVNALWKCILPLMASLVVSSAQSQCVRNNFCHLPGKSGISSISSMVARPQPLSCTGLCSQSDSCFVVTFDSSSDICELHSDPDGAECFIVRDDPKKSLWLRKPKGNSCPKGTAFPQESTCNAEPFGNQVSTGYSWNDEGCAFVHGPITGIRAWVSPENFSKEYVQRLQVRYGDHWGPIHPSGMPSGTLTEICLEDGESFTHVDVMDGWVIDILHFHSNLRAHDAVGYNPSQSTTRTVPLKDVIYFSGAAYLHDELRVTKFLPHREDCDS